MPHPLEFFIKGISVKKPGDAVYWLIMHVLNLRLCARQHVPKAEAIQDESRNECLRSLVQHCRNVNGNDPRAQAEALALLLRDAQQLALLFTVSHRQLLAGSLLISAFSVFDAFVASLLRCLYLRNTDLLRCSEKSLTLSKLIGYSTVDQARDALIEEEIESLLREKYSTAFSKIAHRFNIGTLTKFESWPVFVEASQRRNLITHCDGIVSNQYLEICRREGVTLDQKVTVGTKLTADLGYLETALTTLYETGVKLGQVLWRKACPSELNEADNSLTDQIIEVLTREEWELARRLTEFSVKLPRVANDLNQRIMVINHAQAIRWSGDPQGAIAFLNKYDWTSAVRDFRLAVAVLQDDYSQAADLMRHIGRTGELVNCRTYIDWPLFREFRTTDQFRMAFEEVYGVPFQNEARRVEEERFSEIDAGRSSAVTPADESTRTQEPTQGQPN